MHTTRSSSCQPSGVCLSACMETPQVWAWRSPPARPLNLPPWVWAWIPPPGQTPQLSPWVWAWRPPSLARLLKLPLGHGPRKLQGMLGYHPLVDRQTHVKILGSESFARWLVSLALALEIELALDIERYHITASVNHLTCPLPPHQSVI